MGFSMFQKRLQNSTMSIDLQEQKSKGVFSCYQIHFMEPDGIEVHASRPWFCKMAFLLSCDVGIYFDLTEPDVPAFEESYEAASTDIKKNMRFKIWNAPTVVLSSKLLFCDFLCSLTMKIRSFDARFQCRMKHIHTRVRSAIENIDSANETSTVEPPSVALL